MKNYVVWLKGGNSIEGTIEDEVIEKLCDVFQNNPDKNLCSFEDADGKLVVKLNEIQAIAVNRQIPDKKIGITQ